MSIGHKPAITFRNKISTSGTKAAIICNPRVVVVVDYKDFKPNNTAHTAEGDQKQMASACEFYAHVIKSIVCSTFSCLSCASTCFCALSPRG